MPVAAPAPSSLQRNVELALVDVNENDGELPFVRPSGPPVTVVSGNAESTVIVRVPELPEVLPAASVARAR